LSGVPKLSLLCSFLESDINPRSYSTKIGSRWHYTLEKTGVQSARQQKLT
jgi:hypothetical protein